MVVKIPGCPVSVPAGWKKFIIGNEITQSVDVLNMGGQIQCILSEEDFHISCPLDITLDNEWAGYSLLKVVGY